MNEFNANENLQSKTDNLTFEQIQEILISEYRIAKAELLYEENETHSFFDYQLVEEKIYLLEKIMGKLNIDYSKETTWHK